MKSHGVIRHMLPMGKVRYVPIKRRLSVERPRWQRFIGLHLWDRLKDAMSSYTLSTIQNSSWFSGLAGGSWSSSNYVTLERLVKDNPYSARALWLMKEMSSSLPWTIGQKDGERMKRNESHTFHARLEMPNAQQSYQNFIGELIEHVAFGGEYFIYTPESALTGNRAGLPGTVGMRLLRPDRVTRITYSKEDPHTAIEYRYEPVQKRFPIMLIDGSRVLHVKLENAADPDRGFPLWHSILRALDLMKEADEWNKSISEGKGRVPGYINWEPPMKGEQMDPDTYDMVKRRFRENYDSARENNTPFFLGGEYSFTEAGMSLKEADFIGASREWARQIAIGTGFDPALLGDSEHKTYSNLETAIREAFLLTVLPFMEWVFDSVNMHYLRRMGKDLIIIEVDQIQALQEDAQKLHDRLLASVKEAVISRDEMREKLGWKPIGGVMAQHTVSLNTMLLDRVLENEALLLRAGLPGLFKTTETGDGSAIEIPDLGEL